MSPKPAFGTRPLLLLLLRHAKSSWKHEGLTDHQRPLNRRGWRDAPRIGRLLRSEGLIPELILTSNAVRARTTAHEVAAASGSAPRIVETLELYLASPGDCLDVVRKAGGRANPLMLVGHNPTLEELLELLTGESHAMPTAALAAIELPADGDWKTLAAHPHGELAGLWRPEDLDEDG